MRRGVSLVSLVAGAGMLAALLPAVTAGAAPQRARPDKPLPAVVPFDDDLTAAVARGEISEARYALERARSLVAPVRTARRYGDVAEPAGRDATLVLRDLALRVGDLSPARQQEARALLARPTDGIADPAGFGYDVDDSEYHCTAHVCVHWVDSSADAPPPADGDGNGVPDWVETTATVFERVWRVQVTEGGYRPPKSDLTSPNHGPDGTLDVYLADVGSDGLYGFCSTDDPHAYDGSYPYWDLSAYCAVDDDFAQSQFGRAPIASLRVTAAHEFFHAVQFAYDAWEDRWLMEGSAAWIEDEVFDGVNDNRQYLGGSSLARPALALDAQVYGSWAFFRFMSEHFGPGGAHKPTVVRQVWRRADGSASGADDHSLQAVARVSGNHGTPFRALVRKLGWVTRQSRSWFSEGATYPVAPLARSHTLTKAGPGSGARAVTLTHLAHKHVALRPGRSLRGAWRLRVTVNLPDRVRGSAATVTVVRRNGTRRHVAVSLDRRGDGRVTTGFRRADVARVELTVTNASTRYHCWQGTGFACAGVPRDDGLRYRYTARALR